MSKAVGGHKPVPAIRLAHLTKKFGSVVANDDVSLSVYHGQILSILGENGSGKTTLMNMISGIYYPDEGQIFVNGEEVTIVTTAPKVTPNKKVKPTNFLLPSDAKDFSEAPDELKAMLGGADEEE